MPTLPLPSPIMPVDLVDSANRVIGRQRRDQIEQHRKGFRVAHVFLYDEYGRLWLQRLAAERDRHALRWGSSVAAYLFAGESYLTAAKRRITQELGIAPPDLRVVANLRMPDRRSTKFIRLFAGRLSRKPPTIDQSHIAEYRRFCIEDLKSKIVADPGAFTPTLVRLIQHAHK